MRRIFPFLFLAACAAPHSAPTPTHGAAATEVIRRVETLHGTLATQADAYLTTAARDGFSGAVIVEDRGRLILAGGYGLADREAHRAFTLDTIAQLGSNTKSFTGAAIANLQRQGLIDLDQPVGRYLPHAAQPGASATLRQLLTHTSHMREYCGEDFARRSRAELESICMANPLDQAFTDEGIAYSNPGYSVLADVVETVSGKSIEAYVHEDLLRPLGIVDGGYTFPGLDPSRFAAGYQDDARQEPIDHQFAPLNGDYWNLKGNGGMQMSARAVYRWYRGLACRAPMNRALRDLIVRPLNAPAGDPDRASGTRVSEGYGWAFRTTRNGTPFKLAHAGSDGVFLAYEYWRPYDGMFLYFVSNIGETRARPILVGLRRILGDARQVTDDEVRDRADVWRCATSR